MSGKTITWIVVGVLVYWFFFKDSVTGSGRLSGGFSVGAGGYPPGANDGRYSVQGPSPSGNTWANASPYPFYPPPAPPAQAYQPGPASTNAWDVVNSVVNQAGNYFTSQDDSTN
jgi:hypothetical protein